MFSNLIRHYRRTFRAVKLASVGLKKILNKRVLLIVANVYNRKTDLNFKITFLIMEKCFFKNAIINIISYNLLYLG